jgi:hypothetical protein
MTPRQAFELISDPIVGTAQTEDDPGEGTVDASDRFEGEQVITWWNDITKDKRYEDRTEERRMLMSHRYKNWPAHIQGVCLLVTINIIAHCSSIYDHYTQANFTQSDKIHGILSSSWTCLLLRLWT